MMDYSDRAPGPSGTGGIGRNKAEGRSASISPPTGPRVLKIELRPDDGKRLRAFVDIALDSGIIIRGFRILQEQGKRPSVSAPMASIKLPGKEPYLKTMVVLPDEIKGEIDLAILSAWHEAKIGQKEKDNGRLDSNTSEDM